MDYKEMIIEMINNINSEGNLLRIYGYVSAKYLEEISDKNECEEQN